MTVWSRKNLGPWVEQHLGPVSQQGHTRFSSAYRIEQPTGRIALVVVNKKARLADFTINRGQHQIGVNVSIWEWMARAKVPVRLAVCFQGRVHVHRALDLRRWPPPEERVVHGQEVYDERGVAWWPAEDFVDATDGFPAPEGQEAEPKAPEPQPSILEMLR